ncbi:hypothetical protein [Streptomyces mayteni]
MFSRPSFIDDAAVARAVAAHWLPEVTEVEHLPWGLIAARRGVCWRLS